MTPRVASCSPNRFPVGGPLRPASSAPKPIGPKKSRSYWIPQRITLVVDNLNTHTQGAFYTVCEPAVACAYIKRLDFVYTPKPGSWLNIAECELSALTRQDLTGRWIGHLADLQQEIAAWTIQTNDKQRAGDWQFKTADARVKLKRLYPNF